MLSEIFCGIFLFNERSRRWHDDPDGITPLLLRPKSPWRRFGETEHWQKLVKQFDVHPHQIQDWKKQLLAKAEHVFGAGTTDTATHDQVQQKVHAKIGPLTMEKDFLADALGPGR